MKLLKVAAAALNQTPLDWAGNLANIAAAIGRARDQGAQVLCLPELAVSGYGCEDAFFYASLRRSVETAIGEIAKVSEGICVAAGLPLWHENDLYDGVCLLCDGQIAGFSAKHFLAGDGVHYEQRWFKPWTLGRRETIEVSGGTYPLGDYLFDFGGTRIGFEICEDAWAPLRAGAEMAKGAVDIILNPSASHFAFGKHEVRKRIVQESSRAFGAVYVYANLLGNEAGRVIYDGGCFIASAGRLAVSGARFSFDDVTVVSAVVDIEENRRAKRQLQSFSAADLQPSARSGGRKSKGRCYETVKIGRHLAEADPEPAKTAPAPWEAAPWELGTAVKEQEFSRAVSLGLFDYMRKSRSQGYVISLSGGADSAAAACMVALLVKLAVSELGLARFLKKLSYFDSLQSAADEKACVTTLLTCVYQATRNSSARTAEAAKAVADELGATFFHAEIQQLVDDYTRLAEAVLGRSLSWAEDDLPLQNIQARTRGPLVWLIANVRRALLIATSNRSEAAVGYTTMDGDTCGGLSPLAGIDKAFLLHWLAWLSEGGLAELGPVKSLESVIAQPPTAELRPLERAQTDEADLMPYPVLDAIERLAIRDKKLPLEVLKLMRAAYPATALAQLADWVERFFTLWSRNQWKRERYAPSFHLDDENLDPKTWCRFPILSGGFAQEIAEMRRYVERENAAAGG